MSRIGKTLALEYERPELTGTGFQTPSVSRLVDSGGRGHFHGTHGRLNRPHNVI